MIAIGKKVADHPEIEEIQGLRVKGRERARSVAPKTTAISDTKSISP